MKGKIEGRRRMEKTRVFEIGGGRATEKSGGGDFGRLKILESEEEDSFQYLPVVRQLRTLIPHNY